MVVRNREALRHQAFPTVHDSAEGLVLLESLLVKLEHQDQIEGTARDVGLHGGHPGLPREFQEPLDKERVVRRLIQHLSEHS